MQSFSPKIKEERFLVVIINIFQNIQYFLNFPKMLSLWSIFSESEFCLLLNLAKKSLDILSLLNKLSVFQDVVIILKCGPDILKFSQYLERLYLVNIFNSVHIWNFYNWPIFQMISLLEIQLILWKLVNCENLSIFYFTFLSGKTQSKSCRKVKVEVCW